MKFKEEDKVVLISTDNNIVPYKIVKHIDANLFRVYLNSYDGYRLRNYYINDLYMIVAGVHQAGSRNLCLLVCTDPAYSLLIDEDYLRPLELSPAIRHHLSEMAKHPDIHVKDIHSFYISKDADFYDYAPLPSEPKVETV